VGQFRQVLGVALVLQLVVVAGRQEDPRSRIRATAALVVVPVTVKDAGGQAVLDLRREEFRVFEDDVEQEIQLFSAEPFPLSAVVLIDNDLPQQAAKQVQSSSGAIAAAFSEFDEIAVGLFDMFYKPVLDFTSDNDKIHTQLKRLMMGGRFPGEGSAPMTGPPRVNPSPTGPTVPSAGARGRQSTKNLDDAIYAAAELLRNRARERRKVILVVSDGLNSRNNIHNSADTLKLLLTAGASVYAIGVREGLLNRKTGPLRRYAHATGGDVFFATARTDLESLYASIAEQARNQYTLAYAPSGTDRRLEYHSLEVRVRRPHLTLLAREGYYVSSAP
jgi:VWFA-related protein